MKITIEVPDVLSASFSRPSLELLRFIEEVQKKLIELTQYYRKANGDKLFSAFVRNGVDTVFDTEDARLLRIAYYNKDEEEDDADLVGIEYAGPGLDGVDPGIEECRVVMERDRPGSWVVVRLNIEGWPRGHGGYGFETLYSSDFVSKKGKLPRAVRLLRRIVAHLVKQAHLVPEFEGFE